MKSILSLAELLDKWANNIEKKAEQGLEETAEQVWQDVIENAPMGTGEYISSIQIYPIEKKGDELSIFIGSDLMVGPAKSNGKSYNLGYLLEHGTLEHAIPNAFDWGNIYGYNSPQYMRTLQKDWHPGSIAIPHYSLAIEKNKKLFRDKIMKEITWR